MAEQTTSNKHRGLLIVLCGPSGADITGSAIPIDGGWSAS